MHTVCSLMFQETISGAAKECWTIVIFSTAPWESMLHDLYEIHRQLVMPYRKSYFLSCIA